MRFSQALALLLSLALIQCPAIAAPTSVPATQPTDIFSQLDANADSQLQAAEIPDEQQALFVRLLRTSDQDRNGALSRQEFSSGLKPTRKAKPVARKAPLRLPGADELLLLLAMMDANADGKIAAHEPPERLQQFYQILENRIGTNEQGMLVIRRISQGAPRLTQAAKMFVERQEIDVDLEYALLPEKNWKLVVELNSPRQPGDLLANTDLAMEFFHRIDANGDGEIVYEEVPEQFADRFDRLLARADRNRDKKISEQEFQRLSTRMRKFTESRQSRKVK